jgi:hypothetical protein
MGLSSGPNSATLGLTFAYDVGDIVNSYIGEPTTNLIPSPEVNAYPTAANGWCTYNTNQYCGSNGCGNFWPIPSVASVSSNIVTTVSAHTIRSFDVLRPQTTGGGLTANTDYLMRKISDTQFSIHAYNSSQNGSQGYINSSTGGFKVHDSYWLDQRVSINASSFPTMWWGAPHLPNSGLVKEAIAGGFDVYPSRKTDCLRLHYFRTDGVADGMAYCVDASTVSGSIYNVSFWTKSNTPTAVGKSVSFSNYNYGTYTNPDYSYHGFSFSLGPQDIWQRQSYNFTATHTAIISYWFGEAPGSTSPYSFDLANILVEQKDHPTQFVAGTRSVTQGLLPLTGSSINLADVSYNSSAQMVFDGTNDKITLDPVLAAGAGQYTIEAVFKANSVKTQVIWEQNSSTVIQNKRACMILLSSGYGGFNGQSNDYHSAVPYSAGVWYHWVIVVNKSGAGNAIKIYVNGTLYTQGDPSNGASNLDVGNYASAVGYKLNANDEYFDGQIPVVRVYNRAINANEVQENYKGYKTRFNLA